MDYQPINESKETIVNVSSTTSEGIFDEPVFKRSLSTKVLSFFKRIFKSKAKAEIAKLKLQVEAIYNDLSDYQEIKKKALLIDEVAEFSSMGQRMGNFNDCLIFKLRNLTDSAIENIEILAPERFIDMKNANEIRTKKYVLTFGISNVTLRDAYMALCFSKHKIKKFKVLATKETFKNTDCKITFVNRDVFGRFLSVPFIPQIDSYQFAENMVEIRHEINITMMSSIVIGKVLPKTEVVIVLYPSESIHFKAINR